MPQRKRITYSQRPNHAARSAHARGERQFRTYDTSFIRPKQSKAPVIVAIILALVVGGGLIWGAITLVNNFMSPQVELLAEGQEATIVVEEGSGAQAIGQKLVDAKLIATVSSFTKRVNEMNAAALLKPGTYTFVGGASLDSMIQAIEAGPVTTGGLTIPEGFTIAKIAERVAEVTEARIPAEEFVAAASDASIYAGAYPFLADAGTNTLEGFLFPKTYALAAEDTADSIIRKMLDQFQKEIVVLDFAYPESHGLSLYETLNLASIVEKEAGSEHRETVATVFYNRLETLGDPSYGFLQSDATTAYEVGHDPTPEEVHADTPYSTYSHAGLPPTPICSPSIESLKAVCAPDTSEEAKSYFFFYFTPDEAGKMQYFFSRTYDEHMSTFS